jgi:type IV pilus assembly protein PilV
MGCAAEGGFSLIEVLVTLIIASIGLLGIAKMQALAYSSTGTASARSLVAIQTAGLAAAMHANRAYWAAGFAPPITITNTVISDATLNTTATTPNYCMSGGGGAPCGAAAMAAFDLHTWANALSGPTALLPNSNATTVITCQVIQPVNCTIQVTWQEKTVAINTQGTSTAGIAAPTYTLYVEP